MFCPKCGKKNIKDANFCKFCGESLPKDSIQKGSVSEESSQDVGLLPTTRARRFLNFIIDYCGSILFGVFLTGILFGFEYEGGYFYWAIITGLYYLFFEGTWAKTPGKFITKTKVVNEEGKKPDFKTVLLRTLIRYIPLDVLTFLSPNRPRGWHDKWSKTFVIDE